jgi:hypothetical protein
MLKTMCEYYEQLGRERHALPHGYGAYAFALEVMADYAIYSPHGEFIAYRLSLGSAALLAERTHALASR